MEENKLIAEFMGGQYVDEHLIEFENFYSIKDIGDEFEYTNCFDSDNELKYHSSWDWLMPVVEKIEMLGYKFEKIYQPIDKDWQCLIVKGLDILHQEFDESSIKATHYIVVEFIKRTKKST